MPFSIPLAPEIEENQDGLGQGMVALFSVTKQLRGTSVLIADSGRRRWPSGHPPTICSSTGIPWLKGPGCFQRGTQMSAF